MPEMDCIMLQLKHRYYVYSTITNNEKIEILLTHYVMCDIIGL
jgi:hypothetical protein